MINCLADVKKNVDEYMSIMKMRIIIDVKMRIIIMLVTISSFDPNKMHCYQKVLNVIKVRLFKDENIENLLLTKNTSLLL